MLINSMMIVNIECDPFTFLGGITSRDASFQKEAFNDEMEAIVANYTWKLVDLQSKTKPICCKWTFRCKLKADGSVEKFKPRLLLAKGRQKGTDYFDTYALAAWLSTFRVTISIVSLYNLAVH